MRIRIGLACVVGMLGLVACGSDNPTCSSEQVTNLVKKIGKKQLAADMNIGLVFDIEKSGYSVDNIVTTESSGNKCTCKGNFVITWELTPDAKRMKQDPIGWASFKSNTMPHADDPTLSLPIDYSAQMTDDGKNIVVNASGF